MGVPLNHPNSHVRRLVFCPVCGGPKDKGLLVCGVCNTVLKRRHDGDYGDNVDRLLNKIEHTCTLNAAATHRS